MTSNILTFDFIIQYKDRPTPMNNYGLGEFISSVLLIDKYDFDICVHIILYEFI